MDQEHRNQVVENLLAELNPDQRACVVLRDIQGLSYEEIAQSLNININTLGIINPYKEYSFQKLGLGNVGNLILIFIIDYPDIIFTDIHRNLLNQIFT